MSMNSLRDAVIQSFCLRRNNQSFETNHTNTTTPMNDTIKNLTEKERQLFNAVIRGMDAHGCGWYHELLSRAGMEEDHSSAGVLGSLVKKELVDSEDQSEPGMLGIDEPIYWVKLTDEAGEALGLTYDKQYYVWDWDGEGDLPQV